MGSKENRKVKYDGIIELNGINISCFVLEDGTRVLSSTMQRSLSMVDDNEEQSSGARLSRYLSQKSLQPFIYKGREPGHFEPIVCYQGNKKINGYEASVLVDICDAFLEN